MKVSITIPESLDEINLGQYQKWISISEDKEINLFLQQKMIEIFCNTNLKIVTQLKLKDVDNICKSINKLFDSEEHKFVDRFTIDKLNFGFIPKLDDMSLGEYVDLDLYINDWDKMHKAIGVLYRPIIGSIKNKYNIEEYKSSESYNMLKTPLSVVFGALVFFFNLKNELSSLTLSYLVTQTEIEIPQRLQDLLRNGVGTNQFSLLRKEIYNKLKLLPS